MQVKLRRFSHDIAPKPVTSRVVLAMFAMLGVYVLGTVGYFVMGRTALPDGHTWPLIDCFYMTVISVTTVGYGEYLDVGLVAQGRAFTIFIILLGGFVELYVVSILTTFLVEGHLSNIQLLYRMRKRLKSMSNHVIVCGVGRSGYHVAEELALTGHAFVAIDQNMAKLQKVLALDTNTPSAIVEGDLTERETLEQAGIARASSMVVALPDDKATLFTVMMARDMSADLHIVAKSDDPKTVSLLRRAGADRIVATKQVSGLRLASETIRPDVVDFLALMVRATDDVVRFEQVQVQPGSEMAGQPLSHFAEEQAKPNLCIVAVKRSDAEGYVYGPTGEFGLEAGDTLILVGDRAALESIERLAEQT